MANEGALSVAGERNRVRDDSTNPVAHDLEKSTPFGLANVEDGETVKERRAERRRPALRRLNLNLPVTLYEDLSELAESQGKSMTEIVRTGLGLAHIAYTQLGKQRKLLIADTNGNTIREIFIPW
ncbi:MAG TPA: hypothetical protein VF824_23000 [Thermoanaerobaculia bacterium]|jgi:hypothetical protein